MHMAEIHGDMTQDEIDDQLKRELAARIGSSTETNPVRLSTAEATRVLELLGGPPKGPAPERLSPQAEAAAAQKAAVEAEEEDDDDDEPVRRGAPKKPPGRR
jgi:hypothetical protein